MAANRKPKSLGALIAEAEALVAAASPGGVPGTTLARALLPDRAAPLGWVATVGLLAHPAVHAYGATPEGAMTAAIQLVRRGR